MIISRPKTTTLFSVGIFLFIVYAVVIYTLIQMLNSQEKALYQYILLILLTPIAVGVSAKVLLSYKIIKIGKDKLMVKYPLRFKENNFNLKKIDHYQETVIKTKNGIFKELKMVFPDGEQVSLTQQENADYDKILQYLQKKYRQKGRSAL